MTFGGSLFLSFPVREHAAAIFCLLRASRDGPRFPGATNAGGGWLLNRDSLNECPLVLKRLKRIRDFKQRDRSHAGSNSKGCNSALGRGQFVEFLSHTIARFVGRGAINPPGPAQKNPG